MVSRLLGKWDILALLEELDGELITGGTISIVIGGGSAVAFWDARRGTLDVDIISHSNLPTELVNAAKKLAQKHNLADDWLNNHASKITQPHLKLSTRPAFIGKKLHVYIPDHKFILAMKLAASRDKDESDIAFLMKQTGITTKEQLYNLVKESYPRNVYPLIDFDFLDSIADNFEKGNYDV